MKSELGYYMQNDTVTDTFNNRPEDEKRLFQLAIIDHCNAEGIVRGIEIGVLNGDTSRFLLNIHEDIFLTGIDPLIPDSMEASLIGSKEQIDQNCNEFGERWAFIHDYSFNVNDHFKSEEFDFIFIDGDHTYEAVKQDFNLYFDKIKSGGLIFFHDSRMNRGGAPFHVGSSKFVDEVIANDDRLKLIGEAFSLTCFIKQ